MPPTDDRTKKRAKTPRLGRGLSSLMASPVSIEPAEPAVPPLPSKSTAPAIPVNNEKSTDTDDSNVMLHLPLKAIVANRHQPREHFDAAALERLAASIRAEGVMQPVVVRPDGKGGYELVAGERRWRAAGLAGLATVPALVRDLNDAKLAEWALIENLQREDLNPIERAVAFQNLGDTFALNHAQIAERVGLDRSTVTNLVRLLKLAEPVRDMVSQGTLSMGQARALAGLEDHQQQEDIAGRAIREGWTVRRVEDAVRLANSAADPDKIPPVGAPPRAAYLQDLERQIAEQLKTKVKLKAGRKKGAGTLSIDFYSIDEFDQLLGRLGVSTE